MPSYMIIPLAFLLGFALVRVATCTVAATGRWVSEGKLDWLFGLTIVAAWAGLVLFFLVQYSGRAHLPVDIAIGPELVFGAIVMGIGAVINRGCFVGTVGYIGAGKFSYLLTFVGLGLALLILRADWLDFFEPIAFQKRVPVEDSIIKQGAIAGFVFLALISLWLIVIHRSKAMLALLAIGISSALIYGTHPEWSYNAVFASLVNGQGFSAGALIELAVAALFAGAIFGSWLRDRFKPQFGDWKLAGTNLIGGLLMGIGAGAVPGGNDVLLMWTMPGLAAYGVVAYLIMVATIALAMKAGPPMLQKCLAILERRTTRTG